MRANVYERDRLLKWALAEGRGTATEAVQIEGLKALLHVRRRRMAEMEYVSLQSPVLDSPFYRNPDGSLAQDLATTVKIAIYKALRSLYTPGTVGLTVLSFMQLAPSEVANALRANLPVHAPLPYGKTEQLEGPARYAAAPEQSAVFVTKLMEANAAIAAVDLQTASLTLTELKLMVTQQYAIEAMLCGAAHMLNKGIASFDPLVFDVANYFTYGMLLGSTRVEIDVLSITTNLSGVYKDPDTYASKLPPSAQP